MVDIIEVNFKPHLCENTEIKCFTNHEGKLFTQDKTKLLSSWVKVNECPICKWQIKQSQSKNSSY